MRKWTNLEIIREHRINGTDPDNPRKFRRVDGIIHNLDLIIEFDEYLSHRATKDQDSLREKEIKKVRKDVIFFRVAERDWYADPKKVENDFKKALKRISR
jgi:hypothetical protein